MCIALALDIVDCKETGGVGAECLGKPLPPPPGPLPPAPNDPGGAREEKETEPCLSESRGPLLLLYEVKGRSY